MCNKSYSKASSDGFQSLSLRIKLRLPLTLILIFYVRFFFLGGEDKKYFSMLQIRLLIDWRISILSFVRIWIKGTSMVTFLQVKSESKTPSIWVMHIISEFRILEQQIMFCQPLVSCYTCWGSLISSSWKLGVGAIEGTDALNSIGFYRVKFYTRVPIRT